jgi:hypothetical protein
LQVVEKPTVYKVPGTAIEGYPWGLFVMAPFWSRLRSWVRCHLPGNVPDKAGQFPGGGNTDLVQMQMPGAQAPIALTQPALGTPGDVANSFGLSLLTPLEHCRGDTAAAIVTSSPMFEPRPDSDGTVNWIWPGAKSSAANASLGAMWGR